jgi:adenine-specific DNA-methyltransferase
MPDYSRSELYTQGLTAFKAWLTSQKDRFTLCDNAGAYESLLSDFITGLLQPCPKTLDREPAWLQLNLQPLVPEQVGTLYEYLRSFHLERPGEAPTLVPNIKARRNQGLFYTPDSIVEHIVNETFTALGQTRPERLLDLKILDPAVGAGRFLVRVLKTMTRSIMASGVPIEELTELLAPPQSIADDPKRFDTETRVKIHLLENCLYGVDIDPIAAQIALSALRHEVFGEGRESCELTIHVECGNSLIGSVHSDDDGDVFPLWPDISKGEDSRRFDWFVRFPEVITRGGFDLIVGNPPYEIVSVKESGLKERKWEQKYFRSHYKTCSGKLNTYRLMLERSFRLLREKGALGFIIPMTLLADTSARELRKLILDNAKIEHLTLISEKAKVFENVTQALAILVITKGGATDKIVQRFADADGPISELGSALVSRELIDRLDLRIPIIRSEEDKRFLEKLTEIVPFKGDKEVERVGTVHQGEINLTTSRKFITTEATGHPLIRGEHVNPLVVRHPAARSRLDWVSPVYADQSFKSGACSEFLKRPWEHDRIVLARVVNMNTRRRLKAAPAPAGWFLGDMTNYFVPRSLPQNYLLGLLNSHVLNHRVKLTSANNYISAAEIEALPIPRLNGPNAADSYGASLLDELAEEDHGSISLCVGRLKHALGAEKRQELIGSLICRIVEVLTNQMTNNGYSLESLWTLLDASVVLLYGVEFYGSAFDPDKVSS